MGYAREDEWQMVRYGRKGRPRKQLPPFDPGARGGRRYGGMDSAFPAPPMGERDLFPSPNRPVPPRRAAPPNSRYFGPQSRSYAEVVRQGRPRPFERRWDHKGSYGPGVPGRPQQRRFFPFNRNQRITPTDPKFGQLVRKMHMVIKIVHHLQNVTPDPGKPGPNMISRMVETLATMIKPAAPSANTTELIVGNARNWGYTTLIILQDHYRASLEEVVSELSKDLDANWKSAFEVATRWARKNLSRIKQEVIDHAEALITASRGPDKETGGGNKTSSTQTATEVQGEEEDKGDEPDEIPRGRRSREDPSQVEFREEVVDVPQVEVVIPPKCTVATMTEEELPIHPVQPEAPKEQRKSRTFQRQIPVEDLIEDLLEDSEVEKGAEGSSWGSPILFDWDLQENLDNTPTMVPSRQMQVTAQVHRDPHPSQIGLGELEEDEDSDDFDESQTSTPTFRYNKVTKHIHTTRKLVDWGLSISKKWLIIGDSNLARFPRFSIPDLQIDSYPGANFRHAQSIILKAIGQVTVEKVVLSFGINSRKQKAKETAVKQLQAAVKVTKTRFPHAEIWIPLLNYSADLPVKEQESLDLLNAHIFRNFPYIERLGARKFRTEMDMVHWTRETAQEMFQHWVSKLNLRAP